jgi:hypothetical protein
MQSNKDPFFIVIAKKGECTSGAPKCSRIEIIVSLSPTAGGCNAKAPSSPAGIIKRHGRRRAPLLYNTYSSVCVGQKSISAALGSLEKY